MSRSSGCQESVTGRTKTWTLKQERHDSVDLTSLKDVGGGAAQQFPDAVCAVCFGCVEQRNVIHAEGSRKEPRQQSSQKIKPRTQRSSKIGLLLFGVQQKHLIQHLVPSFLVLKAEPELTPPVVELTGSRPGQRRRHGPPGFYCEEERTTTTSASNKTKTSYLSIISNVFI